MPNGMTSAHRYPKNFSRECDEYSWNYFFFGWYRSAPCEAHSLQSFYEGEKRCSSNGVFLMVFFVCFS
jgi:hypothetical protein